MAEATKTDMTDTEIPPYFNPEMRRHDLARKDWPAVCRFLADEMVCRVAVHDDPFPYVVAQSYVFLGDRFFFHCTRFGKLAALIRANSNLTIEIDRPIGLLKAPKGQNTSLEYYSVIARCSASIRDDTDDVRSMQYVALGKYRPEQDYTALEDGAVNQIVAFDCKIVEMSAKKRILADGQYSPPGQPQAPYLRYPVPPGASISALPEEAFDPRRFDKR